MQNIVLIAPPAAGKGTLAQDLQAIYHVPIISIGSLLRGEATKDTAEAAIIRQNQADGVLVADDTTLRVLKSRLLQDDCKDGYLLDGYPRNVAQAGAYDLLLTELNKTIEYVFYLDIEKELAIKRTLSRITCPKCTTIFNTLDEVMKPKVDGICDKCGAELVIRSDDNEKTFETRFNTYLEQTQPLIDYYKEKGLLIMIDSNQGKDYTLQQVQDVLQGTK